MIEVERQGQNGSRENSLDRMSSASAASSSAKRRTISPRPESLRYTNIFWLFVFLIFHLILHLKVLHQLELNKTYLFLSSGVVPDGWRPSFIPTNYPAPMRGSPASKTDTNHHIRSHQSPPPPLPPRVHSPTGGTLSDSSVGMGGFPASNNNSSGSNLFGR